MRHEKISDVVILKSLIFPFRTKMESGYRKWTAKAYVGDCVDVWTPDFSFVIHVNLA